jgi:hypothetical protein
MQMREQLAANAAILKRLAEIDKTLLEHDSALRTIWQSSNRCSRRRPNRRGAALVFTPTTIEDIAWRPDCHPNNMNILFRKINSVAAVPLPALLRAQLEGVLPKSNRSADSHVRALRTPLKTSKIFAKWIARTQRSALRAFGQHALPSRLAERSV